MLKEFFVRLFGGKPKPTNYGEGYSPDHNDFLSVIGVPQYKPGGPSIFNQSEMVQGRDGWQYKIDRDERRGGIPHYRPGTKVR